MVRNQTKSLKEILSEKKFKIPEICMWDNEDKHLYNIVGFLVIVIGMIWILLYYFHIF